MGLNEATLLGAGLWSIIFAAYGLCRLLDRRERRRRGP